MKVEISLPAEKRFAKPLRDFVFSILKKIVEDEYVSESLSLAIAEAYVNVWEHEKYSGNIKLSMVYENKTITFYLEDGADKINMRKLKSRLLSDFREGGLGLYIISSVMDESYYEDMESGNKLVLIKKIK